MTTKTEQPQEDEIDLMALVQQLFKAKVKILFATFAATLLGVAYAFIATPIYTADALVQLEEKSNSGAIFSDDMAGLFGSEPQSATEIEILRSRMILGTVIENLKLEYTAEPRQIPIIGGFLSRVSVPDPGWGFLSSYAWHDEAITVARMAIPETMLKEKLLLTSNGDNTFTVDLGDGRQLAGRVGETLQDNTSGFALRVDDIQAIAGRQFVLMRMPFSDVILGLRERLSIGEKGKKSGILRLGMTGDNPIEITNILDEMIDVYLLQDLDKSVAEVENSLGFVRDQIPEAQGELQVSEQMLSAYQLERGMVDLSFETRAMLEESVIIEAKLGELELQEQEIQKRFTPSHPLYQTLLDNRRQLQQRLGKIRNQAADLPEVQQEMLRLTQDMEVAREIYLQLVGHAQELEVAKAGTLGSIRVIDRALAETRKVKPSKAKIVMIAFILGGIVAVGYILVQSLLSRVVETAEHLEDLGVPVYASVSKVGNGEYTSGKLKDDTAKILAKDQPTNLAVEALRSLRTSLHFGMLEAKTNLLMITSSRPGEGKSFLSINLATVMAQSGQNVCLVDADIRRGYLRHFFGVEKSAPGLTDVLAGNELIEDVIKHDEESGLFFIPAGKYPPNPSELLMHKRFGEVVEYLDDRFDIAILDTPPLLAVTDPVIIGKYVGMILLVTRHLLSEINEVKAALKVAENNGLKITGAVLNVYDAKKAGANSGAASYTYDYKSRD